MAKVTFEFDDIEENGEILLTANRKNLAFMLYDISQYRRKLYKYEKGITRTDSSRHLN